MSTTTSSSLKNIAFLVCLLIFSGFAFGQSNIKLHQIVPKWKIGDQKRVHTESVSKIFIKDSLFNNTELTANYNIKVVDTVKNYTILYSHEPNALDIETKSSIPKIDTVVNLLTEITKKIERETSSFRYEILVDKKTGLAFKVKNADEYLNVIEKSIFSMIDELGEKKGKTKAQIDSMKGKLSAYCKLAEPKVLETTINQFNYIMQPYSYLFPYNSSISQRAMVHDVNALGDFGDVEMPAVLTISSKESNSTLTVGTDTDYDKDFLLEQIKKKNKNMGDIKASDIFLSDKVETVFAIKNSWILSHKSDIVFELKEVRVINQTIISFQ